MDMEKNRSIRIFYSHFRSFEYENRINRRDHLHVLECIRVAASLHSMMIDDNALHEFKSKQISEITIKLTMSFSIRRLRSHNG